MAATKVVSRENIDAWALDSPKLWQFRKALEAMQAISDEALGDERGYQWCSGVHGGFGGSPFCHHGDDHFLTWHRPYLLDFELKLRARIAEIAGEPAADEWRLPYWAWDADDVAGLPPAFTDATYDDHGTERPNPLFSMPYQLPLPVEIDPSDVTWRDPGTLEQLQSFRARVEFAFTQTGYHDFSTAIEDPHNRIHGWTGGFMATYRSAFDPLFWVHHANIDRQFWLWQQGNGHMASIPPFVRNLPCQPFKFRDIRAEAFFDTRELGYTYSAERQLVLRRDAVVSDDAAAPLVFDFGPIRSRFTAARVNVHGVRHPEQTVELRFFANRKTPASAGTPETIDEGFLGSYMVLGHGPCPGAPGHCDPDAPADDLRPPHHLAPFDVFIPVTEGVRALQDAGADALVGELVIVDHVGRALPTSAIRFDNATVTYR